MSSQLLREYVSLILEKIRTRTDAGGKFNLQRFKSFDNNLKLNTYAWQYLEKIGQGSSRAAYLLSSRYVLKIAVNKKGLAQNEAEVDVFTNPRSKPVVAQVYQADPDFRWLISDLVNPLSSENEFNELTGENWKEFMAWLQQGIRGAEPPPDSSPLLKASIQTARENKLMFGDLNKPDHWGKTPDGKVVLLDYGFTGEIWEKHYSKSQERQADQAAQQAKTQVDVANAKTAKQAIMATRPSPRNEKTVQDRPPRIDKTMKAG